MTSNEVIEALADAQAALKQADEDLTAFDEKTRLSRSVPERVTTQRTLRKLAALLEHLS